MLGGILVLALSIPMLSGTAYIIERGGSTIGIVLLALLFRRKASRTGLNWRALGYDRPTRPVVVAGLTAGLVLLLVVSEVTGPLDMFLFSKALDIHEKILRFIREGGIAAAALLLPDNGLLTPVVEEYAWRGYIQNRLTESMGLRRGVTVTALLFAMKHVVADFSVFRMTTLLVAAFALGLLRVRWGTTATTITHIVANSIATSFGIAQAFGWISE